VNYTDPLGLCEAETSSGINWCVQPIDPQNDGAEIIITGRYNPLAIDWGTLDTISQLNAQMFAPLRAFEGGAGGGTPQPPKKQPKPAKPDYCSSAGYRIGDFIDSKIGNGIKIAGGATVLAGGAVGLATGITGVGVGVGATIAGIGGIVYSSGTAVSTIGNGVKWLSGQDAGTTMVGLLSVPTMALGPVSQIAADQAVSYFGGKGVSNPCD
jgi:hypothetical protein